MKLIINTTKLQEMVSKAVRGTGNNKLLPITEMLGIKLDESGELVLSTTDGTNYLYISESDIAGDSFNVTVYADIFSKLIARMTCEKISMELKENYLEVKGNGTYKIELPFDENGNIVQFPNLVSTLNVDNSKRSQIKLSTIQTILNSVKPALATTLENPCYTAYWAGDKVLATDSYMIASYAIPVFDEPKLINANMMDLLSVMTDEIIEVTEGENILVFSSTNCTVYGKTYEGINEFAIEPITGLLESEFGSSCEINKTSLLQVLDRLTLFIRPFDDGNINMTFTNEGLVITSMANSGSELIHYMGSDNFKEFHCSINVNLLQSQVKSNISDGVKIYYGEDSCIKIIDGMITKIVALNETN